MNSSVSTYSVLKADRERGIKLLFELYSKKLLNYAVYTWKAGPDTAWDLIYKTMYKAADVIHEYEFESEEKFASFIFKIFMNYLQSPTRSQNSTE